MTAAQVGVDPVLIAAQNALALLQAERPELTFEIVLPAEESPDRAAPAPECESQKSGTENP